MTPADRIIAASAALFGTSVEEACQRKGKGRGFNPGISTAIYLLHKLRFMTDAEIGRLIDRSERATRSTYRRTQERMNIDKFYASRVRMLMEQLRAELPPPDRDPPKRRLMAPARALVQVTPKNDPSLAGVRSEMKRLRDLHGRGRGWSVNALARRYHMHPNDVRDIVGEPLLGERR